MQEYQDASEKAKESNEQRTLSDFLDEGDIAAGLQAWLKLTNNSISGLDDGVCITEEDT